MWGLYRTWRHRNGSVTLSVEAVCHPKGRTPSLAPSINLSWTSGAERWRWSRFPDQWRCNEWASTVNYGSVSKERLLYGTKSKRTTGLTTNSCSSVSRLSRWYIYYSRYSHFYFWATPVHYGLSAFFLCFFVVLVFLFCFLFLYLHIPLSFFFRSSSPHLFPSSCISCLHFSCFSVYFILSPSFLVLFISFDLLPFRHVCFISSLFDLFFASSFLPFC